jgi:hypothetical protein
MQDLASPEHQPIRPPRAAESAEAHRVSILAFLVALVLFIVAIPFLQDLPRGDLVQSALLTLVLVSGLLAIGARRGTLVLAAVLVIAALAAKWVNHFRPEVMPPTVHLTAGVLFLALVSMLLLRFILRATRVNAQVLQAGIATYLVFGLLWTLAYMLVDRLIPDSFVFSAAPGVSRSMDGFNALYFSFVTLSTAGYGDIVPAARVARLLAILEATTGVLYMSVLIARLVGLYSSVTPLERENDTNGSSSRPSA